MANTAVNIKRNFLTPVLVGATGIGASPITFQKFFESQGAPGILQLSLLNVVGSFSSLQINVEFSPDFSTPYWETVGTWNPLSTPAIGYFPIGEAGYYRLNVTSFTGGTSFDVYATISLPAGSVVQSGSGGNVTIVGSTITLPVSISSPVTVTGSLSISNFPSGFEVFDGSGNILLTPAHPGVTEDVSDGTPGSAAPATALQVAGWDGTDLRALLTDNAGQLKILVENFPATVAVTQSTSPWVVSGSVTANQGTPNTAANSWPVEVTDGTNILGTASHPLRTDPIGTTAQPVKPDGTVWSLTGTSANVNVTNSLTITGTVSVTQGTSPWVIGFTAPQHVIVDSGSLTANIGTTGGLALDSTLTGGTAKLQITDGTNALGAFANYGTSPGAVKALGVNAFITNTPAVTLTSTTITGTVAVTQSTSPWVVSGTDSDNAANSTTKVPTIPARANAAAPTWTEGHEAPLSVDLTGALRVSGGVTQFADNAASGSTPTGTLSMGWDSNNSKVRALKVDGFQNLLVALASDTIVLGSGVGVTADSTGNGLLTAAWTSATGNNTALTYLNGQRYPAVTVKINTTTTITGGVLNFEYSTDNQTNWIAISGLQVGTTTIASTYTLAANAHLAFQFYLGAAAFFRVRLSPAITGTGTVNIDIQGQSMPVNPLPTVQGVISGNKTNNNAAPGATNIGVLPAIANASAPSYSEGDQVLTSVDLSGNTRAILAASSAIIGKVQILSSTGATIQASTPLQVGTSTVAGNSTTWDSTVAQNTALSLNSIASGTQETVFVNIVQTTPFSAGALTFEMAIDGSNYIPVVGVRVDSPGTQLSSYTLQASTNILLRFDLGGGATSGAFRVRLSTAIVGAGTVTITSNGTGFPSQAIVTVAQAAGTNLHVNVDNSITGTVALSAGSAVIGHVITDSGSVTNATLSAETTKVIGVVRNADGAGNLLTTNSTTFASKFALDANLLGTLGTAFTTAGKVDVKAADGDVFVRQATAANLNATVVFASPQHVIVDSSGSLTVAGNLTNNNAAPAGTNIGALTCLANASTPVFTEGDLVLQSVDLSGQMRTLPAAVPAIVQKNSGVSSGSVASIAVAFGSNTKKGNTLVVVCAQGNNGSTPVPVITDTLGLTWNQAVLLNNSGFVIAIFYAVNNPGGADTITVTRGAANTSIAAEIYEVSGLLYLVPGVLDQINFSNPLGSTGTALSSGAVTPVVPNEIAFGGFAVGTAAQTITVTAGTQGWANDSGQLNPTTPSGLFSFVSASAFSSTLAPLTAAATIGVSEPWAAVIATFKPVATGIFGTVAVSSLPALPAGSNVIGHVIVDSGSITAVLSAGSAVIGHVLTDTGSTTAVTQATAANLNATVVGNKSNNIAAPGSTNVGALTTLANASNPSWLEGAMVVASSDTSGNQRVQLANAVVTLQASQVSAITNTTTTRTTTTGLGKYKHLDILVNITGAGVATGTLQLFLQDSADGGTTWDDLCSSLTFAFGASVTRQRFFVNGELIPSTITTATSTNTTQGSANQVETMGAGSARQGPWGDQIRVREVVSGVSGSPTGVTYTITCVAKG
jgi:hypothetical protein